MCFSVYNPRNAWGLHFVFLLPQGIKEKGGEGGLRVHDRKLLHKFSESCEFFYSFNWANSENDFSDFFVQDQYHV